MLNKKQLQHIEKRLLEERARALRSLGLWDQMAKADREFADSDLAAYTDHMADQGTESMEREKAALFATKEGRYLYRLEEALGVGQGSPGR
jgi:DnaK suppressor protein